MIKKTLLLFILALMLLPGSVFPQDTGLRPAAPGAPFPYVDLNVREAESNREVVLSIQLLLLLAVLTLAPSILISSNGLSLYSRCPRTRSSWDWRCSCLCSSCGLP
jgi:flagellar biosynthesis protein FliP